MLEPTVEIRIRKLAVLYITQRIVEFRDTDTAGLLHFTAFFGYMESVEHEFLRSLGRSVVMYDESGKISWPRVSAHCDFSGAVRFEDVLDIQLGIRRMGSKSVSYAFRFLCSNRDVACGELTSVCCRMTPDGPKSMVIPEDLQRLLLPYVQPTDSTTD